MAYGNQSTIWSPASKNEIAFNQADFGDDNPLAPLMGGGGGGGMSFRMGGRAPLLTSGFGDTLNLGGGPMPPAQALHELNLERNKYTPDSPYYLEQAIFSGEKPAQDAYKAAVASGTNWDKPRGYTADELARFKANALAHTDTQGTIMNWAPSKLVAENKLNVNAKKIPSFLGPLASGPGRSGSSTAAAQRAASIARANKSAISRSIRPGASGWRGR